jgi:phenylacetaldehyde dehydrogenase
MKEYKMWIGGKWVNAESGKTYTVVNPATEEEIAKLPLGDKADIDKAVEAARKAFPAWSKKTQAERSKIVNKIAIAMEEYIEEIAQLDVIDHGTPIKLGRIWSIVHRQDAL